MTKNYYRSEEERAWPLREIVSWESADNPYDEYGPAFKLTLACGHSCVVTGQAAYNVSEIHCKKCGEK